MIRSLSDRGLGGSYSRLLKRAGLKDKDLLESFVRSSKPGGQKVNKTSSCVYLKHLPTGIEVKCQGGRSQSANRVLARKILAGKILGKQAAGEERKKRAARKKRLLSRRFTRAEKEKKREIKQKLSEKKRLRVFKQDGGD